MRHLRRQPQREQPLRCQSDQCSRTQARAGLSEATSLGGCYTRAARAALETSRRTWTPVCATAGIGARAETPITASIKHVMRILIAILLPGMQSSLCAPNALVELRASKTKGAGAART